MVSLRATKVSIKLGDSAAPTILVHNRPPLLARNNGRNVEILLSKFAGDSPETDPEDPERCPMKLELKSSAPRNFYNLLGCARIKEETEWAYESRTCYDATAARDETYRDTTTLGHKHTLPVISFGVTDNRTITRLLIKGPNTVGSCTLNTPRNNL